MFLSWVAAGVRALCEDTRARHSLPPPLTQRPQFKHSRPRALLPQRHALSLVYNNNNIKRTW